MDAANHEDTNSHGIFGESPINTPDLRSSVFSPSSPPKRQRKASFSTPEENNLNLKGSKDVLPTKRQLQSPGIFNIKRNRNSSTNSDSAESRKIKDEDESAVKNKLDKRELVVESGPIDSGAANENDDMDDEFEDDDEDVPKSAAELLSKHRGDDRTLEPSDWEEEYY